MKKRNNMKSKYKNILLYLQIVFAILFINSSVYAEQLKTTLLISLDGFRYNYLEKGVMPTLAEIANEGVQSIGLQPVYPSSTFPNHLSIITGLYPTNHGIVANNFMDYTTNRHYQIGKPEASDSFWYLGEFFWETCKKNDVIAASYFWPGSDLTDSTRNPNYFYKYDHKRDYLERVNGVLQWLELPNDKAPKFITLYFDSADSYGHSFGTDSPELTNALVSLDSVLNYLFTELKKRNLFDKMNIIIVSDHGMINLSKDKILDLKEIINLQDADIINNSAFALIQPKEGNIDIVYNSLKTKKNHFQVYKKEEIPDRYNFQKSSRISNILLIADPGWLIQTDREWNDRYVATHGYDNRQLDMQGIFIAIGPDFKEKYKCNTIRNIDIYPLLCKLFHFKIDHKVDGNLLNIINVLRDN